MGGRGASSGGSAGGGGSGSGGSVNPLSTTSLISAREDQRTEVDQSLTVFRDVESRYGVRVYDIQLAQLGPKDAGTLAYYSSGDNVAINQAYFDAAKMDKVYDRSVQSGFHPSRGNKSGIEAVTAHELGHKLTQQIGVNNGEGAWAVDKVAGRIVSRAARDAGYKNQAQLRAKISGYGKMNNAEAVAEAFADVYCNGAKASRESRAIINVLNSYF